MTYLIHKDYKEASKKAKIIPDVKSKITVFVGKGKKSYEDIIIEIQKTENLTNDEVIKQIKELKLTAIFTQKVVEEIEVIKK